MGCPTTYEGMTATWTRGKLSRLNNGTRTSGISSYTYAYNAFGQRVSRSYSYLQGTSSITPVQTGDVIGYNKQYFYDHSGRLMAEKTAKTHYNAGETTESIVFLYDESGMVGMEYTAGGTTKLYYFQRNLQGDVTAIYDTSGNMVARYLYDAWGNCTIGAGTTNQAVAKANPIRYRGYYYDDDTGLYYCNARYYSPKWRRFISPDDTAYLDAENVNGLNLYCYCNNDPINYVDPSGHMPEWAEWLIGGAVIVGLGVATFFTGGAAGVILGAAFYGAVTGAVSGALLGGISGAISGGWEGFLDGAASGFMMGALIGGATGALSAGLNYITGGVRIVGSAQKTGNLFHRFSSDVHAGKFAMQIGRYSEIGLNAKLKSVGLSGARRPDVTAVARFGKSKLIEVVSKTQTVLSQQQKIASMLASNPSTTGRVVSWALQHWFYF